MQATAYGAPLEAEPDKWSRDDLLRAYERGVWTFPRLRNLGHLVWLAYMILAGTRLAVPKRLKPSYRS